MVVAHRRRVLAVATVALGGVVCLGLVGLPAPAVADPRRSLGEVQAQIDVLNQEAEHAGEAFNDAKVRLGEVTRRLKKARRSLSRQAASVSTMQDVIGQLAAASYKSGGVDVAMQLLLSDDPQSFLQQASALEQLSRQQRAALRQMTRVRLRLAEGRAIVAHERARAAALKRKLATEKSTVEKNLAAAQRLFDRLKAADRARLEAQRRAAAARARASRAAYSVRASRDSRAATARDSAGGARAAYSGPASGRASIALRSALAQLGDPYRWGGTGPGSFDCSGLTAFAWASAGVALPHSSAAQYRSGRRVSRGELRPGDLVFYYSPISHVGIYLGGGQVVHAPYPGRSVEVISLDTMPYVGATRP